VPRTLLILDLNGTLILASRRALPRAPDFQVGPHGILRRPHVREFLRRCSEMFDVAVWTSMTEAFARGVVEDLFAGLPAPAFVWSHDRCTPKGDAATGAVVWTKDLDLVEREGYALERVILADDHAAKLERHPDNLVSVKTWDGSSDDAELVELLEYLATVAESDDVRSAPRRRGS
jgi:TFIIF-interacting CTD phosphatase-like protein